MWAFDEFGDRIALYTDKVNVTYDLLAKYADDFAVAVGGRCLVLIMCSKSVETIAAYVGCIRHDIVPIMLDGELGENLVARIVKAYRPSFVWTPVDQLASYPGGIEVYRLDRYVLLRTEEKQVFPLYEDLALLMTTSGSTGSPKLVRQSKINLISNTRSIVQYLELDQYDCSITSLPIHYVYGLSIVNMHLSVGASLVVTDKTLIQEDFWHLVSEKHVTNIHGVPYSYALLKRLGFMKMDLPDLKLLTQAGGKLDPMLHKEYAEYAQQTEKKFVVMYGAAEATARMGYLPSEDTLDNIGVMGKEIPGGRFELLDENGIPIETTGVVGELVYYGDNVAMGYAESGADLCKGNEWNNRLMTGDLARRNDNGFFEIVGRKKRFLKMFGKRISLQEIELLLQRVMENAEIAVTGRDDNMQIYCTSSSMKDKLVDYVSRDLHFPMSSFSVIFVSKIPRSDAGKILYASLEE